MAETFRRVAGDQVTLGYRQLPSIGSEGPDLKTLVFAGLGVALGIVVGTVMADGSWRQMNLPPQHPIVQAGSSGSGTVNPKATKAAQALPVQAQSTTHGSPQPSVALKSPAVQAPALRAPDGGKASAVHTASLTTGSSITSSTAITRNAPATHSAPGIHQASANREASGVRNTSGVHNVPGTRRASAHRHRPLHGLAGWKRHSGRHKGLRKRRLRPLKRTAITAGLPATDPPLKFAGPDSPFVFTVEGELTISAYDALTGTIETYEGEAFALQNPALTNSGSPAADVSSNIHYHCDQVGSCTLIAGQFVLKAQRTR